MSKANAKKRAAAKQAAAQEKKVIVLSENAFSQVDEAHTFLARELAFPDYYGGNLSALSDCLTDISKPTAIKIERSYTCDGDWFEKMCGVIVRCSLENEKLSVQIYNEGSDWDED